MRKKDHQTGNRTSMLSREHVIRLKEPGSGQNHLDYIHANILLMQSAGSINEGTTCWIAIGRHYYYRCKGKTSKLPFQALAFPVLDTIFPQESKGSKIASQEDQERLSFLICSSEKQRAEKRATDAVVALLGTVLTDNYYMLTIKSHIKNECLRPLGKCFIKEVDKENKTIAIYYFDGRDRSILATRSPETEEFFAALDKISEDILPECRIEMSEDLQVYDAQPEGDRYRINEKGELFFWSSVMRTLTDVPYNKGVDRSELTKQFVSANCNASKEDLNAVVLYTGHSPYPRRYKLTKEEFALILQHVSFNPWLEKQNSVSDRFEVNKPMPSQNPRLEPKALDPAASQDLKKEEQKSSEVKEDDLKRCFKQRIWDLRFPLVEKSRLNSLNTKERFQHGLLLNLEHLVTFPKKNNLAEVEKALRDYKKQYPSVDFFGKQKEFDQTMYLAELIIDYHKGREILERKQQELFAKNAKLKPGSEKYQLIYHALSLIQDFLNGQFNPAYLLELEGYLIKYKEKHGIMDDISYYVSQLLELIKFFQKEPFPCGIPENQNHREEKTSPTESDPAQRPSSEGQQELQGLITRLEASNRKLTPIAVPLDWENETKSKLLKNKFYKQYRNYIESINQHIEENANICQEISGLLTQEHTYTENLNQILADALVLREFAESYKLAEVPNTANVSAASAIQRFGLLKHIPPKYKTMLVDELQKSLLIKL